MARRAERDGLLESRPLYKNAMAVLALIAAISAAVGGAWTFFRSKAPDVVQDNTELIVDTSQGMGDAWEGAPKLAAAQAAAGAVLATIGSRENLALRHFGGPCRGANTELVVPFAQKNTAKAQIHVAALIPRGQASLHQAINEAIGDFEDQKHFAAANKRILVITGSDDGCGNPEMLEAIKDKLAADAKHDYGIRLDFRFIGVGMNATQRRNLENVARITGGKAVFATHPAEVQRTVADALSTAPAPPAAGGDAAPLAEALKVPVKEDATVLVESLTAGVEHLNEALGRLSKSDYQGAAAGLQAARQDERRSDNAFARLGQADRRAQIQELYESATRCRAVHQELLGTAEDLVKLFQTHDAAAYERATAAYNKLAAQFDQAATKVNALRSKL